MCAVQLKSPASGTRIGSGHSTSLNRRLALDTLRGADGADSTITPLCASRPTGSWSPKGRRFPPQDLVPPRGSKCLSYPTVTDPEDPPLRPERHIPNSIATMRIRMIDALIKLLPRCPCCGNQATIRRRRNL